MSDTNRNMRPIAWRMRSSGAATGVAGLTIEAPPSSSGGRSARRLARLRRVAMAIALVEQDAGADGDARQIRLPAALDQQEGGDQQETPQQPRQRTEEPALDGTRQKPDADQRGGRDPADDDREIGRAHV